MLHYIWLRAALDINPIQEWTIAVVCQLVLAMIAWSGAIGLGLGLELGLGLGLELELGL